MNTVSSQPLDPKDGACDRASSCAEPAKVPMYHELHIHGDEHTESPMLSVAGDIDLATIDNLTDRLRRVLGREPPPRSLTVDLTAVRFLATAGLTELVWLAEQCRHRQVRLAIVIDGRAAWHALEVTGLTHELPVIDSGARAAPPARQWLAPL